MEPKPLVFEVRKNGEKLCTAGLANKDGVVSAILSWVSKPEIMEEDCHFAVGGLDTFDPKNRTNLEWFRSEIVEGDEIVIRVSRSENIDPPIKKEPADNAG